LEILKEKISVFEEAEHAQIHAHTRDQPAAFRALIFRFGHLPAEPEIHRCRGKKKRGKGRVPGAVENVTGDDEQIFPCRPGTDAPIKRDDDYEKNDESERIKKHDEVRSNYAAETSSQLTPAILRQVFRCYLVTLQDKNHTE
jgi:hypothetical protein